MIGGIFLLASVIAVFIVLNWFVENDRIPENEPTKGLLAMKLRDQSLPKRQPKRWTPGGRG